MKCKSKRPQGLIYVPKRGAVLKQWGSTLKCFSVSHVCTNLYAGIWVPTEHFLVVKGTCNIGFIKMKHVKSDPPFFLLCSAFLSAECQKSRLHLLHCCLQHWSWSLSASSFYFFFILKFLAPLFRSSWKREILSFSAEKHLCTGAEGFFFFFNKADVTFHMKAMLTFFPCPFSRLTHGHSRNSADHCLRAAEPALARGGFTWASLTSWGNAFQQLLSPHKSPCVNCRRMRETSQTLGTSKLFYSPTTTALSLW